MRGEVQQLCNGPLRGAAHALSMAASTYLTFVFPVCGLMRDHTYTLLSRCNHTGTSKNCFCMKAGKACSSCSSKKRGSCVNAALYAPTSIAPTCQLTQPVSLLLPPNFMIHLWPPSLPRSQLCPTNPHLAAGLTYSHPWTPRLGGKLPPYSMFHSGPEMHGPAFWEMCAPPLQLILLI